MLRPRDPSLLQAALFVLLSEALFVAMGVTVRVLSEQLPNESIVFFRNLFALAVLLPWMLRRGVANLGTTVLRFHLLRSLAGLGAMYCFYYALANMPLAEAVLLKLTAPFFIPLIALLWLDERVSGRVWAAVAVGFCGVALVLRPGFAQVSPAAMVVLGGAGLAGLAKVTIRRLSATEPASRIVFYFALVGALVSSLPLAWSWVNPSLAAWGLLATLAGLATGAQLTITRAYSLAPAAQVGPFTYVSVIYAAALGWMLWDEKLNAAIWLGAGVITVAGVMSLTAARGKNAKRAPTVV